MVIIHIFYLAAIISIAAGQLGLLLPQELNKRFIPQTGGWSLQASTCPTDTSVCGAAWCCPNSLTCVLSGDSDNAEACCPTDSPCQSALQLAPVCADSSWNLWNTTNVDGPAYEGYTGYLCCLPGQIGQQGNVDTVGESAICVNGDTPVPQSLSGTLISAASTQHASTSRSTRTAATATGSSTPTTTSTAASSTVTNKSGAGNIAPLGPLSISGVIASLFTVVLLL